MKTKFIALLFLVLVGLAACSDPKVIGGVTYETYGLLNQDEVKNPDIQYHLVMGNLIWSIVLAETVVAPVYFVGFDLYEPVGPKK